MAKTLNKPFYVVAESYKFARMYPLNQTDLPNNEKVWYCCCCYCCYCCYCCCYYCCCYYCYYYYIVYNSKFN